MAKTQTPGEAFQAELAVYRQAEDEQIQRRRRLEALQLPIMQDALNMLATRPIIEATPDLVAAANNLSDTRQTSLVNLFAHLEHVKQHLAQEAERIQAQVDADAQAEAEAAAT